MNHSKKIILSLLLVLAVACKNDKKKDGVAKELDFPHFEQLEMDVKTLPFCEAEECPRVEVNYLKIEGRDAFSKSVNGSMERQLIQLFNLSEEPSKATSLEEAVKEFVDEYLQFRMDFPDSFLPYEAQVDQHVLNKNEKTVVVETGYYLYTGGAHGYGGTGFLNFDAQTGKLLQHTDLLKDETAFTAYAEQKFREQYEIPKEVDINSMGFFFDEETFALPENIAVTDQEVILLYNPYEAASYAQGQLRFVFPKEEVAQWLNY